MSKIENIKINEEIFKSFNESKHLLVSDVLENLDIHIQGAVYLFLTDYFGIEAEDIDSSVFEKKLTLAIIKKLQEKVETEALEQKTKWLKEQGRTEDDVMLDNDGHEFVYVDGEDNYEKAYVPIF